MNDSIGMGAARDFKGYGREPPHAQWPGDARIAVQFVINYEEGGENAIYHGIEPRPIGTDLSNAEMRIRGGVAVPRKMLGRGEHAALVSAFDVRRHKITDLLGVFAERAYVDDGIRGVGIYVGIGKEIPVHSDGA